MDQISGKTVIISGASRGIGAATAMLMAERGAHIVLAARSADAIAAIANDLTDAGYSALAVPCDVSDYASVKALVDKTLDAFGRIDVLVNNAGVIDPIARIDESDPDGWSRVVDINLKGVFYAVRAALPAMLSQGSGVIINISSGAATGAMEGWSHYCATKAGVLSLTKCLHKEYADKGIRAAGLSPGTVATDMQVKIKESGINPVSQMDFSDHIPPEWVAKAIAWLSTEDAADIAGIDFTLKTNEERARIGLPPVGSR
ncbi:SDR family oxidoreductase [Rhodospirillaceae bacterium KN72]|uniref:SDR family oxidoreductase n=1 Tax=Pacificispira spongiicola TaxID=2729598 RepID=A0A7Y0E2P1_9PROT|nr:SDR family oxidoreductase [Pacificispira spongiicola]NMM46142.1 SDR family oxidoreductase [Pacificispira spongiicola]